MVKHAGWHPFTVVRILEKASIWSMCRNFNEEMALDETSGWHLGKSADQLPSPASCAPRWIQAPEAPAPPVYYAPGGKTVHVGRPGFCSLCVIQPSTTAPRLVVIARKMLILFTYFILSHWNIELVGGVKRAAVSRMRFRHRGPAAGGWMEAQPKRRAEPVNARTVLPGSDVSDGAGRR